VRKGIDGHLAYHSWIWDREIVSPHSGNRLGYSPERCAEIRALIAEPVAGPVNEDQAVSEAAE